MKFNEKNIRNCEQFSQCVIRALVRIICREDGLSNLRLLDELTFYHFYPCTNLCRKCMIVKQAALTCPLLKQISDELTQVEEI